jgi:N-acetylmuramoyl-L-alanine amidase
LRPFDVRLSDRRVIFLFCTTQANRYKDSGEFSTKRRVGRETAASHNFDPMATNKVAFFLIFALAMMLAGTVRQPVRAEDSATQHDSTGGSCGRPSFRVVIDVGHTATSSGADRSRGVPEYEFNLKLADVIVQSLHEAGFDKTVRLVTSGTRMASLFERAASANQLNADLFISIHHDSVPDNLKETWQSQAGAA